MSANIVLPNSCCLTIGVLIGNTRHTDSKRTGSIDAINHCGLLFERSFRPQLKWNGFSKFVVFQIAKWSGRMTGKTCFEALIWQAFCSIYALYGKYSLIRWKTGGVTTQEKIPRNSRDPSLQRSADRPSWLMTTMHVLCLMDRDKNQSASHHFKTKLFFFPANFAKKKLLVCAPAWLPCHLAENLAWISSDYLKTTRSKRMKFRLLKRLLLFDKKVKTVRISQRKKRMLQLYAICTIL